METNILLKIGLHFTFAIFIKAFDFHSLPYVIHLMAHHRLSELVKLKDIEETQWLGNIS